MDWPLYYLLWTFCASTWTTLSCLWSSYHNCSIQQHFRQLNRQEGAGREYSSRWKGESVQCRHPDLSRELFLLLQYKFHYHHYKHQGLDPLIRSVSRVTTALTNVSSVFQLFSFLVVCSDMISKGFGLVAFFAGVKVTSVVFVYLV